MPGFFTVVGPGRQTPPGPMGSQGGVAAARLRSLERQGFAPSRGGNGTPRMRLPKTSGSFLWETPRRYLGGGLDSPRRPQDDPLRQRSQLGGDISPLRGGSRPIVLSALQMSVQALEVVHYCRLI